MSHHCLLDHLPVELLHNLFNYFSTSEILHTFSYINDYLEQVSRSYFQYELNFQSISRSDFDFICDHLQPDRILSLGLSDDIDTPNQSQLFLSRFQIEQFKQLQSLTLIRIESDFLNSILNDLYKLDQLRSLSIDVELTNHIQNQLIHLKLGKCSIDELENILQPLPNLKSLDVCLHMNRSKFKLNLPCKKLIRLNLQILNYRITMNEIKQFLMKLPYLKHFELITAGLRDLLDGYQWEILVNSFQTFNFNFYIQDILNETILQSFRTQFWLKEKYWFVAYKDNSLFSIPRFAPNTIDISQSSNIQSTALSNQFLYDNVKKILMSTKTIRHNRYFPNVNRLELECSVPLKTISVISRIKSLNLVLLDDLLSIPKMPYLCELSIKQNLTMDIVERIYDYRFTQIVKLVIHVDKMRMDDIIKKLFAIFPCVKYLVLTCSIYSTDTIILVIDGFKDLLNVSFLPASEFYLEESNLNLIGQYSQRFINSKFTYQINKMKMTSDFSIHYWIEDKIFNRCTNMSDLRAATDSNTRILSTLQPPPHIVVAGGTSGIGRGIALAYRQHCPAAHITIIGRNESAANEILSQLGSNSKFIRVDCSLMSEIRRITKQINAVDILVLSQGILTMTGRTPTKENIDEKMAISYYGRVLFVKELLPLLRSSPHGGKILFVLNSKRGNPSKVNWNDMALENNYSFLAAGNHTVTFTDLVIQYLASQPENANVTFIHAYPGFVKTPVANSLPFYVRLPAKALMATGLCCSPEECAEFMIHGVLGTEKGWRCIDEKGETVPNKEVPNEEMLKKVWEHTCEITSRTTSS